MLGPVGAGARIDGGPWFRMDGGCAFWEGARMDGGFCEGARIDGGPASAPPKAPGVNRDAMSARGPQNWASEAGRGVAAALRCAFCVPSEVGRGAAALGCALPGQRRLPKARRDWRRGGVPGQGSRLAGPGGLQEQPEATADVQRGAGWP